MAGGFKQVPVKYQQKWDKKTASPQGKREMNINIQENCVAQEHLFPPCSKIHFQLLNVDHQRRPSISLRICRFPI